MDQLPQGMIRAERRTANPLDDIEQKLRHSVFGQKRATEDVEHLLNDAQ